MTFYPKPTLGQMHQVSAAAATLKALANEHRLLLLCALAERPMSVSELNLRVPIAQSALSQHLARLREAGVVAGRRRGPQTLYELVDTRCRRLLEAVCAQYAAAPGPNGAQAELNHHAERVAGRARPVR